MLNRLLVEDNVRYEVGNLQDPKDKRISEKMPYVAYSLLHNKFFPHDIPKSRRIQINLL
jgi:hypothetical protein